MRLDIQLKSPKKAQLVSPTLAKVDSRHGDDCNNDGKHNHNR